MGHHPRFSSSVRTLSRAAGRVARGLLLASLPAFAASAALARPLQVAMPAAPQTCAPAIAAAAAQDRLPPKLLDSIALVESGRTDPATGRAAPWPWTIDAGGVGQFFATKADAIAAVQALQQQGVRSIDVGCMQINLLHHPGAFASLDEAFEPMANAGYGARFLGALYRQTGNWPQAAAAYHSQTPGIGQDYEIRVMAIWPMAAQFPDSGLRLRRAAAPGPDYSHYTPEFAARVRQMVEDRTRLEARFGAVVQPRRQRPAAHTLRQDAQDAPPPGIVRPVG